METLKPGDKVKIVNLKGMSGFECYKILKKYKNKTVTVRAVKDTGGILFTEFVIGHNMFGHEQGLMPDRLKLIKPKSAKKKAKKIKITKKDLVGYSLNEMLTKNYGKKGTKRRKAADARIKAKSKTLVQDNIKKEKSKKLKKKKKNKREQKKIKPGTLIGCGSYEPGYIPNLIEQNKKSITKNISKNKKK